MKPLRYLYVLMFLLTLALPAWAALPPLDDNQRQSESDQVFRGRIQAIYTRKRELGKESSDTQMLLEIEVTSVSKGSFQSGQVVHVHCWVIDRRPERWVGDGGQRPRPYEGAEGEFFVTQSQRGQYHLLHPNGWERD